MHTKGAQAPPSNADATRSRHFRAALRSRTAFWAFFIGVVGGFLVGAYLREPIVMLAGPAAAVVVVVLVAFASADRKAEEEFWNALAPTLGLTYWGPVNLLPLTPVLAAGERRDFEHVMQGALVPGLPCSLGHYTFHVRREAPSLDSDESSAAVWQSFPFTVCVVELAPSMPRYPGVFVRPKRGLFENRHDWLKNLDPRKVDLESVELARAYDVLVAHDQDEATLRELMAPSLIDWLARHPLPLGFELRAGVLCAYLPGHVSDAGKLTWFRDGVRHLVRAAARELAEAPAQPR